MSLQIWNVPEAGANMDSGYGGVAVNDVPAKTGLIKTMLFKWSPWWWWSVVFGARVPLAESHTQNANSANMWCWRRQSAQLFPPQWCFVPLSPTGSRKRVALLICWKCLLRADENPLWRWKYERSLIRGTETQVAGGSKFCGALRPPNFNFCLGPINCRT